MRYTPHVTKITIFFRLASEIVPKRRAVAIFLCLNAFSVVIC